MNARRTLDEVNPSAYSSTNRFFSLPIFLSTAPRGTRASLNYNNEISVRSRPPMKNGRTDRFLWMPDDAPSRCCKASYNTRKREGARGGWEAVSDQRPQRESASDHDEIREIEKEDSEEGGLHYRDV